jgi:hypothetical protein
MKYNGFVLAACPAQIFLSPRNGAVPRRLPISPWQTHFWVKRIIKLKSARRAERNPKPCAEGSTRLHAYVFIAHKPHHAQRRRSNCTRILLGTFRIT